jgi:hypothetical protein
VIERILAYLDARHYNEIIRAVPFNSIFGVSSHKMVQQEALAVALANTGKISDAMSVLANARSCSDRELLYIFHLREFELWIAISGRNAGAKELNTFYKMALNIFNDKQVNAHHIVCCLHAASVLQQALQIESAIKLAYQALAASERNNDEVLKAESLVMLHELVTAREVKEIIEDMMIELYIHTEYEQSRRKLLHRFPDLKHVEASRDADEIEALYEYLLVLSGNVNIV